MIYSVWKPSARAYDYYRSQEGVSDDGPVPRGSASSKLGAAPSDISWRVPVGAVPVGRGPDARGIIVHRPPIGNGIPALGDAGAESSTRSLTFLAIIAAGLWYANKEGWIDINSILGSKG